MLERNALSRRQRLANSRGAAFLLAIYFASLMLFLLGGVSLQRTMTEVRAAQTSRDLQQTFWSAEGAFDRSLETLRTNRVPATSEDLAIAKSLGIGEAVAALGRPLTSAFDDLGCYYENITLPNLKPVMYTKNGSTIRIPHHSSYMICTTKNSEQFQVEMLGLTPEGNSVWLSAFLNRTVPSVTLGQAVVGIDSVTITRGHIAGVNTQDKMKPVNLVMALWADPWTNSLMPNTLATDQFGDLMPTATGWGNNQGHVGTQSKAANAIQFLHNKWGKTVVDGAALGGLPPVTSGGSVYDATALSGVVPTLPEFPGVQVPLTAQSLANTLLPSTRTVDAAGNVTIANHWAAVTAGTYRVKGLTLSDASFSTVGPVDLFVDGPLTVSRSLMYGQPETGAAQINTLKLLPANLRIFVASTGDPTQRVLIERGSVVGGIVYAPEVDVKVTRKSLVLGALVGKSTEIGLRSADYYSYTEATNGTKVYFDQSVAGVTLHPAPGTVDSETLFYRVRRSLSEASDADAQGFKRLMRWFEFIGLNPKTLPAAIGGGAGYGGGGGGCSIG